VAKKIYFLSDFHLGAPDHASSLEREKIIVQFLDEIKQEAAMMVLMIFEFLVNLFAPGCPSDKLFFLRLVSIANCSKY